MSLYINLKTFVCIWMQKKSHDLENKMFFCIYICVCTRIHIYVKVCMHTYIFIRTHQSCVFIYACRHIYRHLYFHVHTSDSPIYMCIYITIYTYVYIYTHKWCVFIYVYRYIYKHLYIYLHTSESSLLSPLWKSHRNSLQHTATHCNFHNGDTLRHTATHCNTSELSLWVQNHLVNTMKISL